MTLDQVAMGTAVRIAGFESLGDAERARLAGLGLRERATITKLLRTPLGDPVECLVGPQLVALENWLLRRIRVEAELPEGGAARDARSAAAGAARG